MNPDSMVTLKDCFYLILGVVIGLIAGIAIYWAPLRQFGNEWKAIWNLVRKRYVRGDSVRIKSGTDLKLYESNASNQVTTIIRETTMTIWHDEGVDWLHTSNGWMRVRVLQVYDPTVNGTPPVCRICHLDISQK
jgi:hypothetical protein